MEDEKRAKTIRRRKKSTKKIGTVQKRGRRRKGEKEGRRGRESKEYKERL